MLFEQNTTAWRRSRLGFRLSLKDLCYTSEEVLLQLSIPVSKEGYLLFYFKRTEVCKLEVAASQSTRSLLILPRLGRRATQSLECFMKSVRGSKFLVRQDINVPCNVSPGSSVSTMYNSKLHGVFLPDGKLFSLFFYIRRDSDASGRILV